MFFGQQGNAWYGRKPDRYFFDGACPCPMAGAAMLRGSLSARPLALQASGLAFGHPCAALGQCQAEAPKA
ncbi:hypothetical protein FRY97_15905 [Phaeodactylibacter luteus]|uniref:Uncharacterized protein n=1 Tax=Phaeodactylibacter luteus TaxID=1564516 RepID=A0A5C6RJE1_9BACT|nr:hypothetical protein FRY97_15905 [Phaeodactylibacter luteus]